MDAVSNEQAIKEVNAWLDYKKVNAKRRENLKGNIDNIVACVQDGTFIIQPDTFIIEHTLSVPLGVNGAIKTLKYKPRMSVGSLQDNLNGVNVNDSIQLTLSYIMALTGEARAILKGLDRDDYYNADMVAVFFVVQV